MIRSALPGVSQGMNHLRFSALLLTLTVVPAGCDDAESGPPPGFDVAERGALVACDGGQYDPVQVNAMLEQYPELADAVGMHAVEDCEDAKAFFSEYVDYVEGSAPSEVIDDDPGDDTVLRIKSADGANLTTSGVLQIAAEQPDGEWFGCTGVLISDRALITAAHCVSALAPGGERNFWYDDFFIDNFNGQDWDGQVRINIHPDYSGTGDAADDIAVVKNTSSSFGFTDASRHRIFTDYLSDMGWMKLYGRGVSTDGGAGAGNLRWMWYLPDWSNADYFLMEADSDRRTCSGDSGGPIMDNLPGTSTRVVAGLHVNSEKWNWNDCAKYNGKQRAVRLQNKVRWIDDMLGGNDHDSCTQHSVGGWTYEKCF